MSQFVIPRLSELHAVDETRSLWQARSTGSLLSMQNSVSMNVFIRASRLCHRHQSLSSQTAADLCIPFYHASQHRSLSLSHSLSLNIRLSYRFFRPAECRALPLLQVLREFYRHSYRGSLTYFLAWPRRGREKPRLSAVFGFQSTWKEFLASHHGARTLCRSWKKLLDFSGEGR